MYHIIRVQSKVEIFYGEHIHGKFKEEREKPSLDLS